MTVQQGGAAQSSQPEPNGYTVESTTRSGNRGDVAGEALGLSRGRTAARDGFDTRVAKALGHPLRIALLRVLRAVEAGLTLEELAGRLAVGQAELERHAHTLVALGALAVERAGEGAMRYRLGTGELARALGAMVGAGDAASGGAQVSVAEVAGEMRPLENAAELALETLLGITGSGVAFYSAEGELLRMNREGQRITQRLVTEGESAATRLQRYAMRGSDGVVLPEERSPSGRARRGELFVGMECVIDGQHGPDTLLRVSGAPIRDAAGATHGAVVVFHDVTRERALEREEANQRAMNEGMIAWAPVGIALYEASDAFLCVQHNEAFLQLVGPDYRAQGTIIGVPLDDLFDAESRGRVRAVYEQTRATGRAFTIEEFPAVLQPEIEPRWYRWSLIPLRGADEVVTGLLNVAIEITEQVRGREQLRRQAANLEALISSMPEAVALADREGRFLLTNAAAEALWGQPAPGDMTVGRYAEVFRCYAPDGRLMENAELPLPHTLLTGETVLGQEVSYERPDGQRIDLLCNAAPVFTRMRGAGEDEADGERRLIGGVVVFQDITRLKALERQRDEFLSIAAHELRTPLTSILASLQVMQRQVRRAMEGAGGVMDDEEGGRDEREKLKQGVVRGLDRVYAQALRLNRFAAELLDTTRIHAGQLDIVTRSLDLRALAQETVEEYRLAHPGREIALMAPEDAVMVGGDVGRLTQVLDNLLSNGLKYSREGAPLVVRLWVEGTQARLAVEDHGQGIGAESLPFIFERFFRAPEVSVQSGSGVGLGLGLYITRSLVERHGGSIEARSTLGEGTTFTMTLPLWKRVREDEKDEKDEGE